MSTNFASFSKSFVSNLISEFGDKTFIISAVLAMKHNPYFVFLGSSFGFFAMTTIGTAVGYLIPKLISAVLIQGLSAALFIYFGAKILRKQLTV